MCITATVLCESVSEAVHIASLLKTLPGVTVSESALALGVDFTPTDTMSDSEEHRTIARLIDIVESVRIHGIVIAP